MNVVNQNTIGNEKHAAQESFILKLTLQQNNLVPVDDKYERRKYQNEVFQTQNTLRVKYSNRKNSLMDS